MSLPQEIRSIGIILNFSIWQNRLSSLRTPLSLHCRRFLRARECFCSRNATLKLQKRGGNGACQWQRGRGQGELRQPAYLVSQKNNDVGLAYIFSPLPLTFFDPSTSPQGCYFYSPQSSCVIKSKMAATTIRTKQAAFARPKYACTAGQPDSTVLVHY